MNINDDIYYEKRAGIIKDRLMYVPHFTGGPIEVYSSLEINGEPEYYTDQKTVSEALEYINYLENKVKELEVRNQIENSIWQETVSKCFKKTVQINLEKTLKETNGENWK